MVSTSRFASVLRRLAPEYLELFRTPLNQISLKKLVAILNNGNQHANDDGCNAVCLHLIASYFENVVHANCDADYTALIREISILIAQSEDYTATVINTNMPETVSLKLLRACQEQARQNRPF